MNLQRDKAGLLLIDVQEKLFPLIQHPKEVLEAMEKMVRGCYLLEIPIIVTEQYPKGLGPIILKLRKVLGEEQKYVAKSSFSCLEEKEIKNQILSSPIKQWIVIGMEAHVCVFLTVRDLLQAECEVVVAADAVTSRTDLNTKIALEEMRSMGARISSVETILFELLRDSKDPLFKSFIELFK